MSTNPATVIIDLVQRGALSQAAYVAAELRLADHLAEGPMNASELARATGTHEPSLRRLLRALVSLDLCIEQDDGTYVLSPAGLLVSSTNEESLQSWLLWFGRHQWAVWAQLLHSVKTGESARKHMTGSDGFALIEQDRDLAQLFNMTMRQLTRLVATDVARIWDFRVARTVVDVGGGNGALLEVILGTYPQINGILFDRPHAIDGAQERLRHGLADRCRLESGDFFKAVPAGADVYILKNIVHDWNDDKAEQILCNCRKAMRHGAALLLVEQILPTRLEATPAHRAVAHADLTMMLGVGGQERTEHEFRDLLHKSGLRLNRITPTALGFSVLEAR